MPAHRSRTTSRTPLRLAALAAATAAASALGITAAAADGGVDVDLVGIPSGDVSGSVTVRVDASASDGIARVDFLVDGAVVGSDTSAPYSLTADSSLVHDGTHRLTARAVSRSGDTATDSATVTVANDDTPTPTPPAAPATPDRWSAPAGGVFGAASVWKADVRGASVAGDSGCAGVEHRAGRSATTTTASPRSTSGTTTPPSPSPPPTPRARRVTWDDCQHKGSLPGGVYGKNGQFEDVPIPAGAVPASGSDQELTVWSPSSDQLWEFWVAYQSSGRWHACWGGRIDHVSTSPGFFTHGFGATATGLPYVGGMVTIADAKRGHVDHAVALQVIDTAAWWKLSYPAQRGDGSGSGPVREGTRFRLDPSLDIDHLHLNPYAAMVAKAAQHYGFVVTDKGGAVAVIAESGNNLAANGSGNPWGSLLGGTPSYQVMKGFPWDRLQALPTDWGKPGS